MGLINKLVLTLIKTVLSPEFHFMAQVMNKLKTRSLHYTKLFRRINICSMYVKEGPIIYYGVTKMLLSGTKSI